MNSIKKINNNNSPVGIYKAYIISAVGVGDYARMGDEDVIQRQLCDVYSKGRIIRTGLYNTVLY